MPRHRRVLSLLALDTGNPALVQSQFAAFARQLPVLYGILIVNSFALAATHIAVAPPVLTLALPAVLFVVCGMRMRFWWRHRGVSPSAEDACRLLRATLPLVVVLGCCFTAWALSLYPYGTAYARFHVAFYMAITVISCIFCLTHMLGAALMLTAIVIIPFAVFFCLTGQPVMTAIAINLLLVAAGMIFVLMRNYRDFAALITSQNEVRARQAEAVRLSEENFRLANIDSLTGLANRRRFLSDLDELLAEASDAGTRFAVALLDLDRFKVVNDVHGHGVGDRLLREVSERLRTVAAPDVCVARLGGDEFGATLAGNPDDAAVEAFGRSLATLLRGPYLAPDIMAEVTASVGIVVYPVGAETAQQMFERADYALYYAKQRRGGGVIVFSREHETMIREAAGLELALRQADLESELSLVFQPIVNASTGRPLGFEALARWSSPIVGPIPPDLFIVAAERMGIVGRLTEILFAKALAAAASWPAQLRLSFNLSAQDLASPPTIARVLRVLAESRVDPRRIDLEITETAVMRDVTQAREALAALRQTGMCVSLDDFGSGFSSLSHIHRLRLDKIKIDRSFVADLLTNQSSRDVIKTIIDLCRNLKLECIVEGVETEAQRLRLLGMGCRIMQGYLFSQPIPQAKVHTYLALMMQRQSTTA
jgi:diguanylate cyclase (GGDEF)-like protein